MASSTIEDGNQAAEGDYPPGSALHYVEIESELGFAVGRLMEAGARETGHCSIAEFTRFVGKLRLPEDASPSAIEAMVGRMVQDGPPSARPGCCSSWGWDGSKWDG